MSDSLILFTISVLREVRVQAQVCTLPFGPDESLDFGLRQKIYNIEESFENMPCDYSQKLQKALEIYTLFQFSDYFGCEYIFLKLPQTQPESVLAIGPFSYTPFTNSYILNLCRKNKLPESHWDFISQYYFSLPVINEKQWMEGLLFTLAHELWGDRLRSITHLSDNSNFMPVFTTSVESPTAQSLDYMETKYGSEDYLMKCIITGDVEKITEIRQHLDLAAIRQRFPNSLRDQKNNLLIFNTICRKAAQYGGVHPIYLDTQSTKYTSRIESAANLKELNQLYRDIPLRYCLLVRRYSLKDYSPTIQKVIMHINFNLTEDLGLQTIAEHFSLNKNYLSTVFKKEVGVSFTAYVNQKRIEHAIYLLNTSPLPIQDISSLCGIHDLNYFSRIFRQQVGMSPSGYRKVIKEKPEYK